MDNPTSLMSTKPLTLFCLTFKLKVMQNNDKILLITKRNYDKIIKAEYETTLISLL